MDQHQTWVTVTFLKDYSAVGEDTQYYNDGEALKDPIEHPYPLAFKAGDQFHCGVCDVGEGVFSLEIEDIGKYGTVWFHGVPTAVIDFKGKPEIEDRTRTLHKIHVAATVAEAGFIAACLNNQERKEGEGYGYTGDYVTFITEKKTLPLYQHERLSLLIRGIMLTRQFTVK